LKLSPFKIFCSVLLLICLSCETKRQFTSKPSKSVSNPDSDLLEVNAVAYHVNDTNSILFVEIINENLIYKKPDTTSAFYAELKVSYRLLPEQGSRKIIDSSSAYMHDRANENVSVKSLKTMFTTKAKTGNNYYVEIQVFDLNKKVKYSKGLNIYKQNNYSEQNFLVNVNGDVSFTNRFLENDLVAVEIKNTNISKVMIDCFFKNFPPAPPPFSTKTPDEMKYVPDSAFTLPLSTGEFTLRMPKHGFYHIRTTNLSNEGLTLFTYDKTFPGVSTVDEMINCTRYIMNKAEFDEYKNAENEKSAIDKFWITIGGSNERAKELLKRYYGRVKEANKYYSGYTQGWKTDRGMIFIIFGPPTNIYKSQSNEIWVYGLENTPNVLRYVFNKTKNPFSDNDYILERSQFYKDPWYVAVDTWRQGHVYINNNR
jgi:GWxTD domain-containing protein